MKAVRTRGPPLPLWSTGFWTGALWPGAVLDLELHGDAAQPAALALEGSVR